MKRMISMFFCTILLIGLVGCQSTSRVKYLDHERAFPDELEEMVVFSLPSTVIKLGITYSVYEIVSVEKGEEKKRYIAAVEEDPRVELLTIPDPYLRFGLDLDSLTKFRFNTDYSISLSERGLIKSINSKFEDKTGDIAADVIASVVNAAEIVTKTRSTRSEAELFDKIEVSRIINPSDLKFSEKGNPYSTEYSDLTEVKEYLNLLGYKEIEVEEVKLRLESGIDIQKAGVDRVTFLKGKLNEKIEWLKGIPYLTGGTVRLSVTVGNISTSDEYHVMAQAGELALIPVKSRSFSNVTQALTFSGNYLLEKYDIESSSSGEGVSEIAKNSLTSISDGITNVAALEQQILLAPYKNEQALLQEEINLLQAK